MRGRARGSARGALARPDDGRRTTDARRVVGRPSSVVKSRPTTNDPPHSPNAPSPGVGLGTAPALPPPVLVFLIAALAASPTGPADGGDEAALVARIRDGDAGAFGVFFDRHHADILRYLARRGVSPDVADDLAQHAFVYVWEHRATLDPARSARALLFRIAHTRALNHFRDTRRLTGELPDAPDPGRADAAVEADLREALAAAVEALPPRRREVFELCFVSGLTHREAADALGLSPKTVEHQMSYALKTLRERLAAYAG